MSGRLLNKRYFIVSDKTAILKSDSNKSAVCVMRLEMAYLVLPLQRYIAKYCTFMGPFRLFCLAK